MAGESCAVLVRNLRARFGAVPVLRGLSFRLDWGERLAIFGPNGAGKTTLLKVLSGVLRPSHGELLLGGLDPAREGPAVRAKLGVLSHQTFLYPELTPTENLQLYGRLYGVKALEERIEQLLARIGLYERRADRVDSLSRGLQQRLAIARAVLHDPPILLLDEPETGLDLPAYKLLESVLIGADRQRTLVMATHSLEQARRLCSKAAILVSGLIVGELEVAQLSSERLMHYYHTPSPLPTR